MIAEIASITSVRQTCHRPTQTNRFNALNMLKALKEAVVVNASTLKGSMKRLYRQMDAITHILLV